MRSIKIYAILAYATTPGDLTNAFVISFGRVSTLVIYTFFEKINLI